MKALRMAPVRLEPCGEVSAARLASLFRGLEDAPAVILAVSGGPDSMALMHLAASWVGVDPSKGLARPKLYVATVDHGLRPDAAADAAFVAAAAAKLGLPHTTLRWEGCKPATRVQERARAARYALLADHARAIGAAHVLTAHHADDQAETVLMRLGRGSGVTGLSGMRRETELAEGVTLVRPLLHMSKAELVAVCRREGGGRFIEDPSNGNPAFARVRLRRQTKASAALGLDHVTLLRLAERMMRADVALNDAAVRFEAEIAPTRQLGLWSAVLAPAADAPVELLLRLLRRAIEHVTHQAPDRVARPRHLRLVRLEALADDLLKALADKEPFRTTLGGARIVLKADRSIEITPEPPRRRGRPRTRPAASDGSAMPAIIKAELPRAFGSLGK